MDFITLKKRAARILNLLDLSSDTILTNKDVNEAEFGIAINDALNHDCIPELAARYPHYFDMEAVGNNFSSTGTVSASSTGTTLVTDDAIFNAGMAVDRAYVHNIDLDETTRIEAFTSTTQVTVDATIGDTWDGDTIRVVDRVITFEGDTTDLYNATYVGVKYKETDTTYLKARQRSYNDVYQYGQEEYSSAAPIYIPTTIRTSSTGAPISGIIVLPGFTRAYTAAVMVRYIEQPSELSADSDKPRLPLMHHPFLKWAAVKEIAIKRGDTSLYQVANAEYEKGKLLMLSDWKAFGVDETIKVRAPRRLYNLHRRIT